MEPQKGSAGKAVPGSGNGAAVVHIPAAVWGGSVELCSHCGAGNALSAAGTGDGCGLTPDKCCISRDQLISADPTAARGFRERGI